MIIPENLGDHLATMDLASKEKFYQESFDFLKKELNDLKKLYMKSSANGASAKEQNKHLGEWQHRLAQLRKLQAALSQEQNRSPKLDSLLKSYNKAITPSQTVMSKIATVMYNIFLLAQANIVKILPSSLPIRQFFSKMVKGFFQALPSSQAKTKQIQEDSSFKREGSPIKPPPSSPAQQPATHTPIKLPEPKAAAPDMFGPDYLKNVDRRMRKNPNIF